MTRTFLTLLLTATTLIGCGGGTQPKVYAAFGDSTTFGAAPHSPPYKCWERLSPTWVETASKHSGYAIQNEGRNGTILTQLMTGTDTDAGCGGKPEAHIPLALWIKTNPHVTHYLFAYGINEAAGGKRPDYTEAIKLVKAAGKTVYLIEPFQVDAFAPKTWDATKYLPVDLQDRAKAIRQTLYSYGVPVIKTAHLDKEDSATNTPDALHPNQTYADAIGKTIAEQLKALP